MQRRLREARVEEFARITWAGTAEIGTWESRATRACTWNWKQVSTKSRASEHRPRASRRATRESVTTRGNCRRIDAAKEYAAADIVTAAMKVFARDPAVVSIDADLATTSGLEAGVAAVDQRRALNVGVAEANMMSDRRGVRGARLQYLGQHLLPVLRLEGAAAHLGGLSGDGWKPCSPRTAG